MTDYAGAVFDLSDQGELHEILTTPWETGDRYRARVTLEPHARGPSTHVHPGFEERFEIESGTIGLRVGSEERLVRAGQTQVVPPRTTHRLWNPTDEPAVVTGDLVFPGNGPGPGYDIVEMIAMSVELRERGKWNPRTQTPRSILQTAVIAYHYREAFALPLPLWLQRAVLRPLAAYGRRRGYRATPSEDAARYREDSTGSRPD